MGLQELGALIARHGRPGAVADLGGVVLGHQAEAGPSPVWFTGTGFALLVQGEKRLMVGEHVIDYGPSEFVVTSLDLPVTGRYTKASADAPALGIGIELDPAEIADLLLTATACPFRTSASQAAVGALGVDRADAGLIDAVTRLARLLDRPRDLPVLGPLVRREIVWRLLSGPQGPVVRQLGLAGRGTGHVGRAVDAIRTRYDRPIRVEELAEESRLSVSAFHRSFRAVTGTTPIRFQQRIRLRESRQLIAAGSIDIAQVGATVGYGSPSQFSREYRREFGVSPSEDRAALVSSGPLAAG